MGTKLKTDPPDIHLGQWLDFFEVSVTDAAKAVDISQGYLSNIIANRKRDVNVLILLRLSDLLGVTINDFYRPLPRKSELEAFKNLSPKAQTAIISKHQQKG